MSGDVLNYTNASAVDIASGELVQFAPDYYGVAIGDILAGSTGSLSLKGVYKIDKAACEIPLGAPVFIDNDGKATATAAAGRRAGICVLAADSTASTVAIKLCPGVATASTAIADVATGGSAVAGGNAAAINSILAALRKAGIITA